MRDPAEKSLESVMEVEAKPETELKLRDAETGYELSRVNVGELFQLKGVHFKVVRIEEVGSTSEVVLQPQGYTSARLKKFKREMQKKDKDKGTRK
jgi:hypothetical protein